MMTRDHSTAAREGDGDAAWPAASGVVIRGVAWSTYEALLQTEEDNPGLRMTYREGWLEIMSPAGRHESVKKMLARLLEAYAEERDLELNAFGSTTFRSSATARGLEPDECYVLRAVPDMNPTRPDLAIEVAITSWKLDRLDVYAGLGVPEVWLWRNGRLEVLVLDGAGYVARARSGLLPEIELDVVASFATRSDQVRAVKEYRALLRR
jgi:Uma2 family endonuclease